MIKGKFFKISNVLLLTLLFCGGLAFLPAFAQEEQQQNAARAEQFEIRYMEELSDHHLAAIEKGNLCVENAERDELRDLCTQMVAAQDSDIEAMRGWLGEWYGISYDPQLRNDAERTLERLREVEGEDFDRAFMEMMVNHHRQAILLSADALVAGFHPELLDLAHRTANTQADEARQLRGWLSEWHEFEVIRPEFGPRG